MISFRSFRKIRKMHRGHYLQQRETVREILPKCHRKYTPQQENLRTLPLWVGFASLPSATSAASSPSAARMLPEGLPSCSHDPDPTPCFKSSPVCWTTKTLPSDGLAYQSTRRKAYMKAPFKSLFKLSCLLENQTFKSVQARRVCSSRVAS